MYKNEKIRKCVSVMWKQEVVIMLMYRGQTLYDDEYLISYECSTEMRNDIKAEIYYHRNNVENLDGFRDDDFYDIVDENSNNYCLSELPGAAHVDPEINENFRGNRDSGVMELC